jgi:hypothetical protein
VIESPKTITTRGSAARIVASETMNIPKPTVRIRKRRVFMEQVWL